MRVSFRCVSFRYVPFRFVSLRFVFWQEGDRVDCDFDRLDLSTNPYLEKNLEFLCNWIDDLSNEQQKFNQYTRNVARQKQVCMYMCACVHGIPVDAKGRLCRLRKCSKRSSA